jgi:predicted anti-sigma-YlaC factor YlaD
VNGCTEIRDLMGPVLDREASPSEVEQVHAHLAECDECAGIFEAMSVVVGAGDLVMSGLEPPPHLAAELADSPCRRWLGLLYMAVDREISQSNLDRLLSHLESCPACREAWHDLTLIHQVGEAMRPPGYLLRACVEVRNAVSRIPILGRRTATAAAYVLALVTSLAIGNPTIIAQDLQATAAEHVSRAANGFSEVAADGRGEARVLLWRALSWGEEQVVAVRGWIDRLRDRDSDDTPAAGAADGPNEPTSQGETP